MAYFAYLWLTYGQVWGWLSCQRVHVGSKSPCGSAGLGKASLVAQSSTVISGLGGKATFTRQVAVYVGQLTHEANQHRAHDGGICADAQKLEACVARTKAFRKQLLKEEEAASGAAGGATAKTNECLSKVIPHLSRGPAE